MNKVIIKARSGEITKKLWDFAVLALGWFELDLNSEKYGKDWNSCHYGYQGLSAVTKLSKSGTITITVE